MEGICGAICTGCEFLKKDQCKGCKNSNGCPFGKKCFIANYIDIGGMDSYLKMKEQLIEEFNSISIDGMRQVEELYPLNGSFVNLEYSLPNGEKIKFLDDKDIYLGTQIECEFNNNTMKRCFGLIANMSFLMICEYEEDGKNPELLFYKKR